MCIRDRYATERWIHHEPAVADSTGSATVKTPGGLVSAHLTLAGDVIKAVYLTGDFFCDEASVMAIERALRWHAVDSAKLVATLRELAAEGRGLPQIGPDDIARVIGAAVTAARRHEQGALAKGCFISP